MKESWECCRFECTVCTALSPTHTLPHLVSWSTASLALCNEELSSNLTDSFSQDFERIVRSHCRYYSVQGCICFDCPQMTAYYVTGSVTESWPLRCLRTQTQSCSRSGTNQTAPIKVQFCYSKINRKLFSLSIVFTVFKGILQIEV